MVWLICGILVDEVLKEGYVFSPWDIISPNITHEKIILVLIVAYVAFKIWRIKHKSLKTYKREQV